MQQSSNSKAPLSQKQKLIRLVHVAKGKLGWDDGTYREALEVVTGKTSSTQCTVAELKKFIKHMESKGFEPKNSSMKHTLDKPDVAKSKKAQIDKIEALLADTGKPWAYAEGMARRMYKIDYLTWCSSKQLQGVITALIKQQQRDNK